MHRLALLPLLLAGLGAAALAATNPSFHPDEPAPAREVVGISPAPEERPRRAFPAARREAPRPKPYLIARPRGGISVPVYARPFGSIVSRLGGRTPFGSPETMGVVRRRGSWAAVVHPALGNGEVGWVKVGPRNVELARTKVNLVLDRSARLLLLRRGDHVVRRIRVGVGRPESPTPLGRFAVTDKLPGSRYGSYYGCCILALSAHQPNLPAGWTGGDRIAIHGTDDPGSIGRASSAGCPRASERDLRVLMRRVPLGAPVFVRA
jgi:L,D-transpeptidase-like protein